MTWEHLLSILQNMKDVKHTSMHKPVQLIVDGVLYDADIHESVTTGNAYFIPAVPADDAEEDNG